MKAHQEMCIIMVERGPKFYRKTKRDDSWSIYKDSDNTAQCSKRKILIFLGQFLLNFVYLLEFEITFAWGIL